jgi:predicted ATPase
MIHLKSINKIEFGSTQDAFPFNVPVIQSFTDIDFRSDVTFLVGENGSGKSTFLETIACAAGLHTIGSESADTDKTLSSIRALARTFKLSWSKKTKRGFFLRSEDFFGYAKRMAAIREGMQKDLEDLKEEYKDRSDTALGLASMPFARELHEMQRDYGEGLDARSHGENYFTLFKARFVPGGLYLLDEPEAPLSPMRQLILLSMMKMMIAEEAQFIVSTHSPIVMAYPDATILNFDGGKIEQVEYERLDHVIITKAFLNDPARYLDRLFADL